MEWGFLRSQLLTYVSLWWCDLVNVKKFMFSTSIVTVAKCVCTCVHSPVGIWSVLDTISYFQ